MLCSIYRWRYQMHNTSPSRKKKTKSALSEQFLETIHKFSLISFFIFHSLYFSSLSFGQTPIDTTKTLHLNEVNIVGVRSLKGLGHLLHVVEARGQGLGDLLGFGCWHLRQDGRQILRYNTNTSRKLNSPTKTTQISRG